MSGISELLNNIYLEEAMSIPEKGNGGDWTRTSDSADMSRML
jgi:hypothetical protein